LVEWYQPDFAVLCLDEAIDRLGHAAAAAHVRLLMTLTVPSDETVFVVLAADSADAVISTVGRPGGTPIASLPACRPASMPPSVNTPWWRRAVGIPGKSLYRGIR
jgi:hypothetical protein